MREKIDEIKKLESPPKVIKIYNKEEIQKFLNLYEALPIAIIIRNKML